MTFVPVKTCLTIASDKSNNKRSFSKLILKILVLGQLYKDNLRSESLVMYLVFDSWFLLAEPRTVIID